VPAPIMTIGICGSGGRKAMVGSRTKTNTVPSTGNWARWPEATPVNVPVPERAGPCTTPAVMLQTCGSLSAEEEIK
jgi:hypothetical protein